MRRINCGFAPVDRRWDVLYWAGHVGIESRKEVKKAFDKGMGAASGKLAAPISKKEVWLDLEIKSVYSLQRPEQALRQPEEYARP